MNENNVDNSLKIQERIDELKEQIGKKVFYNNKPYIMKEIVNMINPADFDMKKVVLLTPMTPISISGDDILNIKDSEMKLINYPDGSSEFKSVAVSLMKD